MRGLSCLFMRSENLSEKCLAYDEHNSATISFASIAQFRVARLTNVCGSFYSALLPMKRKKSPVVRSTTVLLVRRDDRIAMAGDGPGTVGGTGMESSARKVRRPFNCQSL